MRCAALCFFLLVAATPGQVLVDLRAAGGRIPAAVPAAKSPHLPLRVSVRSARMELTDEVAHTVVELRIGNPNGTDLAGRLLVPLPPRVIPSSVKIKLAASDLAASTMDTSAASRALRDAVRAGAPAAMLSGAGAPHLVAEVPMVAAAAETVLRIEHDAAVASEARTVRHELVFASGQQPESCQARVTSQKPISVVHAGGEDVTIVRLNPNTVDLKWLRPSSRPRVVSHCDLVQCTPQISLAKDVDDSRVFALYFAAPEATAEDARPVEAAPRDIVFAVDTSGSMRGEHALLAREVCRRVTAKLSARDRVAVVNFSGEARVAQPLVAADAGGVAGLSRALEALPAAGGTNLVEGLETALRLVDPLREPHVVLCTDGLPTVGATSTRSVLKHLRSANSRHVPVHVVTVGQAEEAPLLDMLADLSGATRLRVPSLTDAADAAARLQRDMGPAVLHIGAISVEGGTLTELTLPGRRGIPAGGRALVTGRIASATTATLKVEYSTGSGPSSSTYSVPRELNTDESWVAGLHGMRWLSHQLTYWREAGEAEAGRREIEAWGRRYGIPTPFGARVFGGVAAQWPQERGRAGGAEARDTPGSAQPVPSKQAGFAWAVVPLLHEMRRVGGRVFVREESGWIESRLSGTPLPTDAQRLLRIGEGSDAWDVLLDEAPELSAVFALEAPILFESAGRLVQIVAR